MRKIALLLVVAAIGVLVASSTFANGDAAIVMAGRPGFVTKALVTIATTSTPVAWGTGTWNGKAFVWVMGVNSDNLITVYVNRRLSPNEMDAVALASPNKTPWEVYDYPSQERPPKPIAVAIDTSNDWASEEGTITTGGVVEETFSRLRGVKYEIREIFKNLTS